MKPLLQGIRVLDFTRAALGPVCTKYLADFGAEVLKVESTDAPDVARGMLPYRDAVSGINRSCSYAWFHTSKRSISLNLKTAKGKEIAKKLVSLCDIVAENFTPGSMKRLGLTYEELKKVNPKIIMISLSALGQTGHYRTMPALGNFIQAWSGMSSLIGAPGKEHPIECGVPTPDYIGAHIGVIATIGSLLYRKRTGKGQHIDLSMLEVSVPLFGQIFLDYIVNGREVTLKGNRLSYAAPHGVYRCQGDDRWCAISVFSGEEWNSFTKAIGGPKWTSDIKFATMISRKENEDELDKNIESWTINHTAEEVMGLLQAHGVAAAVVQNGKDLVADAQLTHRHHFQITEGHQELGTHYSQAPAFTLSKTPPQVGPSPCLGQDNEYVFTQILGMSDTEFVELYTSGII